MNLPKPLLIVIVIVLLIAVVSCGATVARSLNHEEGGNTPSNQAEVNDGVFAGLFKEFAPGSDPVRFPPATANPANCSSFPCVITIPGSGDLRRELRLIHAFGNVTVHVIAQMNGRPVNQTVAMPDDTDKVSVIVSRDDSATVFLACSGSCAVKVNP